MTIDEFWTIVGRAHAASEGDMDAKCEALRGELRKLPPAELKSFGEHFDDCEDRAYTWDLWAAAYIIGGGCSDDSFMDFRATLISMGRQTFEKVVASPASLVDLDLDEDTAFFEGYQYVPNDVHEEVTGRDLPPRTKPHPESPSGKEWTEDTVAALFPKLAEKYGLA